MGAYQNNVQGGSNKSKKRGSVKNSDRLDAFANGRGKGSADWGGCDPARLQAVIVGITAMGGAVTYGLSRDRGAYSLTLMLDEQRKTLWFNGDAELDDELAKVVATLDSML